MFCRKDSNQTNNEIEHHCEWISTKKKRMEKQRINGKWSFLPVVWRVITRKKKRKVDRPASILCRFISIYLPFGHENNSYLAMVNTSDDTATIMAENRERWKKNMENTRQIIWRVAIKSLYGGNNEMVIASFPSNLRIFFSCLRWLWLCKRFLNTRQK